MKVVLGKTATWAAAIAILVGAAYALIRLAIAVPQLPTPVLSSGIAAAIALAGVGWNLLWTPRQSIEAELRSRRAEVYEEFMATYFRYLFSQQSKDKPTDEEMAAFFQNFTRQALVLSSDRFLRTWAAFRRQRLAPPEASEEDRAALGPILGFEMVLADLRREFGHRNKGLHTGDIASLWINDVDDGVRKLTPKLQKRSL